MSVRCTPLAEPRESVSSSGPPISSRALPPDGWASDAPPLSTRKGTDALSTAEAIDRRSEGSQHCLDPLDMTAPPAVLAGGAVLVSYAPRTR